MRQKKRGMMPDRDGGGTEWRQRGSFRQSRNRSDGGGFSGGPGAFRSVGNGRRTRHSAGDRNHAAADGVGQKRKVWQEGSLQYQVRQHS